MEFMMRYSSLNRMMHQRLRILKSNEITRNIANGRGPDANYP